MNFFLPLAFLISVGNSILAGEVNFGENHLICSNELLGEFEFRFSLTEKVLETQMMQSERNPEPTPAWEVLESSLSQIEFTGGFGVEPRGIKGEISGVELKVYRWAPEAKSRMMQLAFSFPKEFPAEKLTVFHNFDAGKMTGQSMAWFGETAVLLYFVCK